MSVTLHTTLGDIKVRGDAHTDRSILRGSTAGGGEFSCALCGWHVRQCVVAPQHGRVHGADGRSYRDRQGRRVDLGPRF